MSVLGICPEGVAPLDGKVDGSYQELDGILVGQAPRLESGEGSLIGGGRDTVGACPQEVAVYVPDGVRVFQQHLGRLDMVVQVMATRLQGRGHATVQHDPALESHEGEEGVLGGGCHFDSG